MNTWYEELGKAIAEEFGLKEGTTIEHQLGSVWVGDTTIMSIESDPE